MHIHWSDCIDVVVTMLIKIRIVINRELLKKGVSEYEKIIIIAFNSDHDG